MSSRGYRVEELCRDPNCGQPLVGHTHTVRCKGEFVRQLLLAFPEVATREGGLTNREYDGIGQMFNIWTAEIVAEMDPERERLLIHLRARVAAWYIWAALTVRGVRVRHPPELIGLPRPSMLPPPRTTKSATPPKQRPMPQLVWSQPAVAAI